MAFSPYTNYLTGKQWASQVIYYPIKYLKRALPFAPDWDAKYKQEHPKPPLVNAVEAAIETGDFDVTTIGDNLPKEAHPASQP